MRDAGWHSITLMEGVYPINAASDFDLYMAEIVPAWMRPFGLGRILGPAAGLIWITRNARVIHMPFSGGPIGRTRWWRREAALLRHKGIKTVVMPYGADAYLYSQIMDPSLRAALLMSYPGAARHERAIAERVNLWTHDADVIITGSMMDGLGRSDVINPQPTCIDTREWGAKTVYSQFDGYNGPVRVLHTPNHRGFKGTEFVVRAVDELRGEGLAVELVLMEGRPNKEVREAMQQVDIFAEQLIFSMYAMSGIEAMASGLPVLVNLETEVYTRPFRRYSFLDECPAVSTVPESITSNLRRLVTEPALRETLGRAGRAYVEKYHSYETAQYMFGAIYAKLLDGQDVDLIRLFHPVLSKYNSSKPRPNHPLIENKLPIQNHQDPTHAVLLP
jgi:hypothetical protein